MRLSSFEISQIIELSQRYFGDKTRVFLFGSRVQDDKRGGDIDLLIIPSEKQTIRQYTIQQIRFLTNLKMKIGDQKIDVLIKHEEETSNMIYQEAEENGVLLC